VSKVYLAGPIAGLTYDEAVDWRERVIDAMPPEIQCFSPMRAKHFLAGAGVLHCGSYPEHVLSTARGVMTRDHWDCRTADLILVNLLGARRVSIGTVMEIAWGYAYRVPVVVAIEPDGSNVHEHLMIAEAIGFRCATLDEAVETAKAVLLPARHTPQNVKVGVFVP